MAASPLLRIGCGKMGGAMLAGWLAGPEADGGVHVVEPNAGGMGELARHPRVTVHADAATLPGGLAPRTVVLAVKPPSMDGALVPLKRFVAPGPCFLSLAAGEPRCSFAATLAPAAAVARAVTTPPAPAGTTLP